MLELLNTIYKTIQKELNSHSELKFINNKYYIIITLPEPLWTETDHNKLCQRYSVGLNKVKTSYEYTGDKRPPLKTIEWYYTSTSEALDYNEIVKKLKE